MNYELRIKNSRGFTLIELLIVIAIIGVLATLLMVNFIGVRQRARDAQRKSDIRQIQSALEFYRSDNGFYPRSNLNQFPACKSPLTYTPPGGNTTTYMQTVPCDPSTNTGYTYTSTDWISYTMVACLENVSDSQADTTKVSSCTTPASFTVKNP